MEEMKKLVIIFSVVAVFVFLLYQILLLVKEIWGGAR